MLDARTNSFALFCKKGPLKVIAVITLWSFLFTTGGGDILLENAWAVRTPLELSSVGSRGVDSPGLMKKFDINAFTIPQYLGQIKHSFNADSDKTVIHIQDAHCNYAAQQKIASIIAYLNKEYGIDMINLEGGAKDYDLSIFTDIRDRGIRQKVADYFVQEGLVSGAEQFTVNNPNKVTLWGIEDVDLYLKNLDVYRNSLGHKEEVNKQLKSLGHILDNLKRHIYSDELLEVDSTYVGYKSGTLEFKEYLAFLIQKAQEKSIDIAEFANINNLKKSLEAEEEIDFKTANNEKDALVEELRIMLSRKDFKELVLKTVEFKEGRISRNEYYEHLILKAKFVNVDLSAFPELARYREYISLYDAVDKSGVPEEMTMLEDRIKGSLYQNAKQKELSLLSKNFALLKNLFNFTLTREDYKYYKENKKAFSIRNYTAFINKEAPLYKITAKPEENINDLDLYREEVCKFFECGFKRDKAFMKNIKFSSPQIAILVTGGFHTENLCGLLKKNNISYISIMPNFKSPKRYECPYFGLLAGKEVGLQKKLYPIIASAYSLQIAAMLSNAIASEVWGKANIDSFRAAVLVREQIARGRDIVDITEDGEDVIFHMADGTTERMSIRALLDAVHQRDIDGQMEKLSEDDFEDIENMDAVLDEIMQFLRSIGASQEILDRVEALKGKNADGRALIRLVHGVTFRGHAGGRGIRINGNLKGNEKGLRAVLIHEIIAGLFGDHFLAERVEQAFLAGQTGRDMLSRAPPLAMGIWRMTPEERLMVDRDFAEEDKLTLRDRLDRMFTRNVEQHALAAFSVAPLQVKGRPPVNYMGERENYRTALKDIRIKDNLMNEGVVRVEDRELRDGKVFQHVLVRDFDGNSFMAILKDGFVEEVALPVRAGAGKIEFTIVYDPDIREIMQDKLGEHRLENLEGYQGWIPKKIFSPGGNIEIMRGLLTKSEIKEAKRIVENDHLLAHLFELVDRDFPGVNFVGSIVIDVPKDHSAHYERFNEQILRVFGKKFHRELYAHELLHHIHAKLEEAAIRIAERRGQPGDEKLGELFKKIHTHFQEDTHHKLLNWLRRDKLYADKVKDDPVLLTNEALAYLVGAVFDRKTIEPRSGYKITFRDIRLLVELGILPKEIYGNDELLEGADLNAPLPATFYAIAELYTRMDSISQILTDENVLNTTKKDIMERGVGSLLNLAQWLIAKGNFKELEELLILLGQDMELDYDGKQEELLFAFFLLYHNWPQADPRNAKNIFGLLQVQLQVETSDEVFLKLFANKGLNPQQLREFFASHADDKTLVEIFFRVLDIFNSKLKETPYWDFGKRIILHRSIGMVYSVLGREKEANEAFDLASEAERIEGKLDRQIVIDSSELEEAPSPEARRKRREKLKEEVEEQGFNWENFKDILVPFDVSRFDLSEITKTLEIDKDRYRIPEKTGETFNSAEFEGINLINEQININPALFELRAEDFKIDAIGEIPQLKPLSFVATDMEIMRIEAYNPNEGERVGAVFRFFRMLKTIAGILINPRIDVQIKRIFLRLAWESFKNNFIKGFFKDINISDMGLYAPEHREVNQVIKLAALAGRLEDKGMINGKRVVVIKGVDTLVGGQRAHAGIERNIIYVAEGAYNETLAMHEAVELQKWQEKALDLAGMDKKTDWDSLSPEERKELRQNLRDWIRENIDEAQTLEAQYHAEANLQANVETDDIIPDRLAEAPGAAPKFSPGNEAIRMVLRERALNETSKFEREFHAHGTNAQALIGVSQAGGKLLPRDELEKLGIYVQSGESLGTTGLNRNVVSTVNLTFEGHIGGYLNEAVMYAKRASGDKKMITLGGKISYGVSPSNIDEQIKVREASIEKALASDSGGIKLLAEQYQRELEELRKLKEHFETLSQKEKARIDRNTAIPIVVIGYDSGKKDIILRGTGSVRGEDAVFELSATLVATKAEHVDYVNDVLKTVNMTNIKVISFEEAKELQERYILARRSKKGFEREALEAEPVDPIESRKSATEKLLSTVQRKAMLVKSITGVPSGEEHPGFDSTAVSTVGRMNRDLADSGFGIVKSTTYSQEGDKRQLITFALYANDPQATQASIQKAIDIANRLLQKQLKPDQEGHIVLFAPQMEQGKGLQLALSAQEQYAEIDNITVVPDAYTDYNLAENQFPDIHARGALARHIAFGHISERNNNLAGRDAALAAIKDFLRQESANTDLDNIKTIEDLLKIENALRIKAIDYEEIVQWAEAQEAIDTSL